MALAGGREDRRLDSLQAGLATELLEGAETLLNDMDDEALLKLVSLDLEKAGI